jgi:hypothetical protein
MLPGSKRPRREPESLSVQATENASLQALKDGSDGTRTRDLVGCVNPSGREPRLGAESRALESAPRIRVKGGCLLVVSLLYLLFRRALAVASLRLRSREFIQRARDRGAPARTGRASPPDLSSTVA